MSDQLQYSDQKADKMLVASPLSPGLGVELSGVDLRQEITDSCAQQIRTNLYQYGVVLIRDQNLSADDLERVGTMLGEPTVFPFVTAMAGHPCVHEIIKEIDDEKAFGENWHSDSAFLEHPPSTTVLFGTDVPKEGGDTLFADMAAAYDGLSPKFRDVLESLTGVYSANLKRGGGRKAHHDGISKMKMTNVDNADAFEAQHPVVLKHPETGRPALYLSRAHTQRFDGMTTTESLPLILSLTGICTRPENTLRVKWKPNSLVIWDNRRVMHKASNDYHGERRHMMRMIVQ